jgi:hypothetical protein
MAPDCTAAAHGPQQANSVHRVMSGPGPNLNEEVGSGCALCPGHSDVNLFGNFEGDIDFYAEVPDRALNLGMTKE